MTHFQPLQPGQLTIGASDFDARPMSYLDGERRGYEPDVARAVCSSLNLEPVWLNLPMAEFYAALEAQRCDVVWFNQAVTPERSARVQFTRPYGVFNEAVLVRGDRSIDSPDDLAGMRVGGLANSTNLKLAKAWRDAIVVPFPGSDRVLPEMLAALKAGEIDALVDDELVLVAAADADPSLRIAFTVPTQMAFAIAVLPKNEELLQALNQSLEALIADGTLAQLWDRWIGQPSFPL